MRRHLCHPDMRRLLLSQYMRSVNDATANIRTLRRKKAFARCMKVIQRVPSQGEPGGSRSATVLAASTNPMPPHLHRSKRNLRNSTTKKQDAEREIRSTHRKDLQEKNLHRKQNRKTWRLIKHADVTLVRNLVASALVPTATQETATAKNAQNQSFQNQTSGKGLLKTFSKQKLASKTNLVKQYMTHRKRYLRNRSTRFYQTLIKKGSQYPKQQKYVAKHHDTKEASSLKYGQKLKIATLNCRGLAALSKRQQLTYIMQQHNIDIMAIQETKQAFSSTESHDGYTFFFSGKQANRGPAHYGVGFIISPQIKHCIVDCIPVNDRMMKLKISAKGRKYYILNLCSAQWQTE